MSNLIREGGPVGGGAALEDVSYEHLVTLKVYGLNYSGEHLTCTPDEGQPLPVLFGTRGFADEEEVGARIALSRDNVEAGFPEVTLTAGFDLAADFV